MKYSKVDLINKLLKMIKPIKKPSKTNKKLTLNFSEKAEGEVMCNVMDYVMLHSYTHTP